MKLVMKFGGTSVASGKKVRNVARLVAGYARDNGIVVVCSAMDDITDELIAVTEDARIGQERAV